MVTKNPKKKKKYLGNIIKLLKDKFSSSRIPVEYFNFYTKDMKAK